MKTSKHLGPPLALEEVKQAFSKWRKAKRHREPIPQPLWDAAVTLSSQYSVNHISKVLRLNYNDLKRRFQLAQSDQSLSTRPRPAFIELDANQSLSPVTSVIDLLHPDGSRMRIHVEGASATWLLELGKSFMENRR